MIATPSLSRKLLYIALFSLGLTIASPTLIARTVEGSQNMCESAKAGSRSEVERDIEIIKSTHEKAEMERAAHSECMKQINQIIGEQISKTNSFNGIFGIVGQVNRTFDIGGAICNAIKDKMGSKYSEISERISQLDDLFDGAGDILKQGKDEIGCVDCSGSDIESAIDAFVKGQNQKNPPMPGQTPPPDGSTGGSHSGGLGGVNKDLTPGGGIGGGINSPTPPSLSTPAPVGNSAASSNQGGTPSKSSDPWDAFRSIFNP